MDQSGAPAMDKSSRATSIAAYNSLSYCAKSLLSILAYSSKWIELPECRSYGFMVINYKSTLFRRMGSYIYSRIVDAILTRSGLMIWWQIQGILLHSADQKETDKVKVVAEGQMIILKHPASAPRGCTSIVEIKFLQEVVVEFYRRIIHAVCLEIFFTVGYGQ